MSTDYVHIDSSAASRVCARAYVCVCVCVGALQGGLRGEQVSGAKGSTEKQWAGFQDGNAPMLSAGGRFL